MTSHSDPLRESLVRQTRRHFLCRASSGLGLASLVTLLSAESRGDQQPLRNAAGGLEDVPHHAPRARRVIYLFQSGGPTQIDLYDPKPLLHDRFGEEVPKSVYPDERKTTMTSGQTSFPTAPSRFRFARHGDCGMELSELLPHLAQIVDDVCLIRSMRTDAINHDPAITLFQTGSQIAGRPSMGAWLSYGLGSDSRELPAFVAMSSRSSARADQPLYDRLWGSGFLPARYQGVKFRNQGDPVLDIYDPPGVTRALRRDMLDFAARFNLQKLRENHDSEIEARIAQYELAFRMQTSIPDLVDLADEPPSTFDLYGESARSPGTYAYNCLLARRLAERGVRFIQLYHQGWDQHSALPKQLPQLCRDTDQASAALVTDLKQRGLLSDTLVVWGGEFGRTVYCQGELTRANYGRDHHPNCFSLWMAGAGVRGGLTYGTTDDYSVNVVEHPVHVHDLQATILHLLGIDHERLTFKYQGRDFRLTDVHGQVVADLLT